MLALTSPTNGDRSVGIVRLRTQAMEFFFFLLDFPMNFLELALLLCEFDRRGIVSSLNFPLKPTQRD
jgi:hypothetical protein